jgi:hypothetical protein
MLPKLKRSRSAASADQPEQTHSSADGTSAVGTSAVGTSAVAANLAGHTSELLVQSLADGRTSEDELAAVLGELNAMPHAPFAEQSTEREKWIEHLLRLDMLLEAVESARKAAYRRWEETKYHFEQECNRCALDGIDDENGLIPAGCAVCGVPKTECMQQDRHFGPRGESPPDAKCPHCVFNSGNNYKSERELQLHIAAKHPLKSQ